MGLGILDDRKLDKVPGMLRLSLVAQGILQDIQIADNIHLITRHGDIG